MNGDGGSDTRRNIQGSGTEYNFRDLDSISLRTIHAFQAANRMVKNAVPSSWNVNSCEYQLLDLVAKFRIPVICKLQIYHWYSVVIDHTITCRIPDDCIDPKRYPLFMGRAVMQELIIRLEI